MPLTLKQISSPIHWWVGGGGFHLHRLKANTLDIRLLSPDVEESLFSESSHFRQSNEKFKFKEIQLLVHRCTNWAQPLWLNFAHRIIC